MFFKFKLHYKYIPFFLFFILINCQLQEPSKNHGIIFLENRANELIVKKSNQNDAIKIMGQPHSKSFNDENKWIYIERTLTKGEYHKLGRHVLKTNNVLILTFDKYGILLKKDLLDKEKKNKLRFSKSQTENSLSKKSFVQKFLQSVQTKMYGNRK